MTISEWWEAVWAMPWSELRDQLAAAGIAATYAWWTARGGFKAIRWTWRKYRGHQELLGIGTGHQAPNEGKEAVTEFCQRLCDALATLTLNKSGPLVLTCGDKIEAHIFTSQLDGKVLVSKVLVGAVDVLALLEAESDREALRCAVHDAFARAERERIAREKAEALSLLPDLTPKEKPITGSRDVVDANGNAFRVFFDADGNEAYRKPLAWSCEKPLPSVFNGARATAEHRQ
jgi:hypothetical protein